MKIYVGTFVATSIAKFLIVFMVTAFTSITTVAMFIFITKLQMLLRLLCFYKAFFTKQKRNPCRWTTHPSVLLLRFS